MKVIGGAWHPRAMDTFSLSELGFLTSAGDSEMFWHQSPKISLQQSWVQPLLLYV